MSFPIVLSSPGTDLLVKIAMKSVLQNVTVAASAVEAAVVGVQYIHFVEETTEETETETATWKCMRLSHMTFLVQPG